MKNPPPRAILKRVPKLYSTEPIPPADKIIYLHFFIGGCDWYIAEYDGDDLFFGFANLNDSWNAEWGYVSFAELKGIQVKVDVIDHQTEQKIGAMPVEIELDEHWQARPFGEIEIS